MLRRSTWGLLLWCTLASAAVIDRIAVIVDQHVIKTSDIDRDLRTTQFLNHERMDLSLESRRKAAERLIDQSVIREEIEKGAFFQSDQASVAGMLKRLLQERFGGSSVRLKEELSRYGLTEEQLRTEMQWQSDVLMFIDERFRPGVLVTDEEVRSYYDQHSADLKRQFPQLKTYEGMEPKIRESLEGERLNQNFEQWIAQARKRDRIEYKQGAF